MPDAMEGISLRVGMPDAMEGISQTEAESLECDVEDDRSDNSLGEEELRRSLGEEGLQELKYPLSQHELESLFRETVAVNNTLKWVGMHFHMIFELD
jgi:hypothetical protein